jgi:hypothetical protein
MALTTRGLDFGPVEAYRAYCLHLEQEHFFTKMTECVLQNVGPSSRSKNQTARSFILFVSLSMISYAYNIWQNTKLYEKYEDVSDLLAAMQSIRLVDLPDGTKGVSHLDQERLEIIEAFGFDPPAFPILDGPAKPEPVGPKKDPAPKSASRSQKT